MDVNVRLCKLCSFNLEFSNKKEWQSYALNSPSDSLSTDSWGLSVQVTRAGGGSSGLIQDSLQPLGSSGLRSMIQDSWQPLGSSGLRLLIRDSWQPLGSSGIRSLIQDPPQPLGSSGLRSMLQFLWQLLGSSGLRSTLVSGSWSKRPRSSWPCRWVEAAEWTERSGWAETEEGEENIRELEQRLAPLMKRDFMIDFYIMIWYVYLSFLLGEFKLFQKIFQNLPFSNIYSNIFAKRVSWFCFQK